MISLQAQLITSLHSPRDPPKARALQHLEKCSTLAELKQIHSQIIRLGLSFDNFIAGKMIKLCSLSLSGDLGYARQLFDEMPQPDAFIYNALMKGYLKRELPRKCILLYTEMLLDSVGPNSFTYPCLIRACSVENGVEEGRQIHSHVVKSGFGGDEFSLNNLIFMYMRFGLVEEAKRVFDRMPQRNDVSWTTLINGYSQWGFLDEAYEAFTSTSEQSSATWNAMISTFVQHNRFQEAFELFGHMRSENVEMDRFVAATMVTACTGSGSLEIGEWIHTNIKKSGIKLDTKLVTAIIDMYCKCGCLDKALEVFNGFPSKGVSTWNSMIGGLALHGKSKEAIDLFKEMENDQTVSPDEITFLNLLNGCSHSGLVKEGWYYFEHMSKLYGIEPRTEHFGCMVDLFGKAGLLEEARKFIDEMPLPADASVLGALVGACKIHGDDKIGDEIGKRVIELDPCNSGRYILLANLYASAGRWEDAANVRRMMNERGVKKIPGFSRIEVGGVVNEFVAEERSHLEVEEIYGKVEEMMEEIRSIGYMVDVGDLIHDVEEEEGRLLYYHSEKLAIAFGLMKTKPGETIRVTKNLRVCRDCHTASKYISKAFDRVIIMRDRNRFHRFENGECSCNDYW